MRAVTGSSRRKLARLSEDRRRRATATARPSRTPQLRTLGGARASSREARRPCGLAIATGATVPGTARGRRPGPHPCSTRRRERPRAYRPAIDDGTHQQRRRDRRTCPGLVAETVRVDGEATIPSLVVLWRGRRGHLLELLRAWPAEQSGPRRTRGRSHGPPSAGLAGASPVIREPARGDRDRGGRDDARAAAAAREPRFAGTRHPRRSCLRTSAKWAEWAGTLRAGARRRGADVRQHRALTSRSAWSVPAGRGRPGGSTRADAVGAGRSSSRSIDLGAGHLRHGHPRAHGHAGFELRGKPGAPTTASAAQLLRRHPRRST